MESKTKCDICGKETLYPSNLIKHKKSVHLQIKPFICEYCPNKRFSRKDDLNSHLNTHGKGEKYPCSDCGEEFNGRTQLKSHVLKTHQQDKLCPCHYPGCNKKYTTKFQLNKHLQSHRKGKNNDEMLSKLYNQP